MNENDQRLGSLNEARDVFIRALKSHEQVVYKLGYEAGFEAGWEAVVRRLSAQKPDISLAPGQHDLSELVHGQDNETPAREALLSIIAGSPGLERQDILETARKNVSTLSERILRTVLQRLREVGELRVDNGRWYIATREVAGPAKEPAPRPLLASDFDE